ncbi:MAG: activase [Spirochaetes bacterium]|nr:activase [Spirochaetota bacterium]
MRSLGINVGSSSIKAVLLEGDAIGLAEVVAHDGNFKETLKRVLAEMDLPADLHCLATGTEGRKILAVNNVIESICVEEALGHIHEDIDAVVSMGGEDLILYAIDKDKKIQNSFSGNKCASGTGEFFRQQLGRMDLTLDEVPDVGAGCSVKKLSSRCSVFMKSDCTHKLNKSEATKGDIVVSLSDVMANKVVDFLRRAKVTRGKVLLVGGVTQNPFIVHFIRERFPDIAFIVPEQAAYFEAYGAALLARKHGSILPPPEALIKPHQVAFERYPRLSDAESLVSYLPSKRGRAKKGGEYILGVDGGSTTTKAALIDIDTHEIVASHYGRTHGDPVKALKLCLTELQKELAAQGLDLARDLRITLAATTGSSREILGVFLETGAVYNEIIAHAVGTTFYDPEIDTLFEIGGQDAKYALIKNQVPIDYAMNEACSAGTGSFIEESAAGDLNIKDCRDIGAIAAKAEAPLKFGEHCSAFINSDIRKAIQQGATREDITAGIVASIVSNYLNRVVGNRTIGRRIVLQGGVAKNHAVPLAFAALLGKPILIPPDPELMGCFGVGILAKRKLAEGLVDKGLFDVERILATEIVAGAEFKCHACDNLCPIRPLSVNGSKYMFGGRCNKYANLRKKKEIAAAVDWVEARNQLHYTECAAPETLPVRAPAAEKTVTVGVPRAFSVHTLWPLYSWFFHNLGVQTVMSKNISPEGTARMESAYCFPAEIAHGAVQDILDHGVDYLFIPYFKSMPSYEKKVHATFCPITQTLPFYIRKAFPDIEEGRILSPVVHYKFGEGETEAEFLQVGARLGFSAAETRAAYRDAAEKQFAYFQRARELGHLALEASRKESKPVIAVLGRPYNAFVPEANMGIPRKFTSRGFSVVPFDILPFEGEDIYDNMYWYYGQQDMKAASLIKKEDNIFLTWISNFSCAPDSFMLHYVKWMMGTKPFLVLELDSHSADAGIDTRVEAFLDIIDGYRSKTGGETEARYDNGLTFVNDGKEDLHVLDRHTGAKHFIRNNPKVKVLLSNMGNLTTELIGAAVSTTGVNAEVLPVPDIHVLQRARDHASGKECVPALLVLGNALAFLNSPKYRKDEIYLLFVPITTGPCRTGQYYVYYQNLFKDLRVENVCIFILSSDKSYTELGPDFSKQMWWGTVIADYMKDIESALRACAKDPVAAIRLYDEVWRGLVDRVRASHGNTLPALKDAARRLAAIPLKVPVAESPKVLVVGEIYVRRDDFAVDELIQHFAARGIIGKVSGMAEWIYYCDFVRERELKQALGRVPLWRRFASREFKELLDYKIEQRWKLHVDHKVKRLLDATGLIPSSPHDMYQIMARAEGEFVSADLQSEISISTGAAASAMLADYSGVVNIAPFACLIGRVIEGLVTPWFRERRYPVMSVEIDGNLLPPSVINKLDIFMLNVLRHRRNPDLGKLVIGAHQTETGRIDRKSKRPAVPAPREPAAAR